MSMKNSSDTIGNRTRDLPTCSIVPQPTVPPRAPAKFWDSLQFAHVFFLQYYFQFIIQLLSFHLVLCTRAFPEVCRLWLLVIFFCFDVVTFKFIPWVQHLCHCWEHNCNWLFGITYRTVSYCSWLSWTFWHWCHYSCDFILRNNKKSQRTKTGKSGLCRTTATFAVASSFCCLCLSLRNRGTDYAEDSCMFKTCFRMYRRVSYKMCNQSAISKWYFIGLYWWLY